MFLTSFTDWKDNIFESNKVDKNSEATLTDIWRGYEVLKFGARQVSQKSAIKQIQKKILDRLNSNPKHKDWAIKNAYKVDGDFGKKTADALGLILTGKPFSNPKNLSIGPNTLKKLGFLEPPRQTLDVGLLATTLVIEAGKGGKNEIKAVANVIANRVVARKKYSPIQIILEKNQFSLWNPYPRNSKDKLLDSCMRYRRPENKKYWQYSVEMAKVILNKKKFEDNTRGATHYFNKNIVFPRWAKVPTWKKHETNLIHTFGRDTSISWAKKPVIRA